MNSFYQANLSFTSQNMGAKKYSRINRIALICCCLVSVVGLVLGVGATLIGEHLLGIYSSDPEVISYGILRLARVATPYFICGLMDCMVGSMRGLGYSILPMIVSLTGACGLRVLWIFTIFAMNRTPETLYLSYPVSWAITFAAHLICFILMRRKIPKTDGDPEAV